MTTLAAAEPDLRLERLFRGLDYERLDWCLLRPPEALAERAGDVDVLVDPADVPSVRRVAREAGFGLLPRGGRDLHAVAYDERSDDLLWVHIQPELSLGGGTIPARPVLEAAVRAPLPRPADPWLFWILLLHVLDKTTIAERHRPSLSRLANADGVARCPLAGFAARRGADPERLVTLADVGDWAELTRFATIHRPPLRTRARRFLRRLPELWNADRARGLTVAILGPDGAGKTTLVSSLRTTLTLPTRTVYMGLTGGLLPLADALRAPGLVFAGRVVILGGRYLRGRWHRARGRIVLFERHTLDGHVPSGMQLTATGRASRRVQAATFPPPDLVLVLDASGATLFERSNEYDAATLEDWRRAYRRLEQRIDALVVIDAEQPLEAVRRQAQAHILRRYADIWARP